MPSISDIGPRASPDPPENPMNFQRHQFEYPAKSELSLSLTQLLETGKRLSENVRALGYRPPMIRPI
jgi:hypothetical protein